MLAAYTFNTQYQQATTQDPHLPNLRLLEGGKFFPDQFSPVLIHAYDRVSLRFFRWGMTPGWPRRIPATKTQRVAPADYLFKHPDFRKPILSNRCLIPADGFYLEQELAGKARTYKVAGDPQSAFCFAGIYDNWTARDGSEQQAFSIITTPASEQMRRFGLQMPLILSKNDERIWLNPQANLNKISQILYSPSPKALNIHPVEELKEHLLFGFPDPIAA